MSDLSRDFALEMDNTSPKTTANMAYAKQHFVVEAAAVLRSTLYSLNYTSAQVEEVVSKFTTGMR
jgi:hypothetical protein